MKKILILITSLIVLVALCATSVFAEAISEEDIQIDKDGDNIKYTIDVETLFGSKAVAKVGDVEYEDLQEAIDAAPVGGTVTLLKDIAVESNLSNAAKGLFNINSDDDITLDLNGKTITVTDNSAGNFIVFYSYGNFTIKNGTVNLTSTIDREWNAQSTIILNRGGNLVVESGTYSHLGGTDMAITFDNSANSFGDAYATINGGEITSTYTAIRMRMANPDLNGNPGNGVSYLTINGGTINGSSRGVWGQITDASSKDMGALDITGGTISGGNDAIRMTTDEHENIDVAISGTAVIDGRITGEAADFNITGGTFTTEIPLDLFADGFIATKNEDGTYGAKIIGASDIFTHFYGYSYYIDPNTNKASVAIGFDFKEDVFVSYCKGQGVETYDIGCAFGVETISQTISFEVIEGYTSYKIFNAKISGINPEDERHIKLNLAMALYVQFGDGEKQYVAEKDGVIQFVTAENVPTITFNSLKNSQAN
ncbi:MAG: hypothetical protein J6D23_07190 [Clostridia bacterium]|nr:hypothetical protein [Clostridia bacterium]